MSENVVIPLLEIVFGIGIGAAFWASVLGAVFIIAKPKTDNRP